MVPLTRRRLHGAVGPTGCDGLREPDGSTRAASPTASVGGSVPTADSTTSAETARVRVADGRPPIWLAGSDRDDGRPGRDGGSRHLSSVVVDSRSRAERVETVDVPAAERARSLLADTSFDRETVSVESRRVEDWFRLDLGRVARQSSRSRPTTRGSCCRTTSGVRRTSGSRRAGSSASPRRCPRRT